MQQNKNYWWITLLLLLTFTAPNGSPIYIAWDGIEVVRESQECKLPARTEIRSGTGMYCVQETAEDVKSIIETMENEEGK